MLPIEELVGRADQHKGIDWEQDHPENLLQGLPAK